MCGIAGYLYAQGERRPETDVERMCQRLVHRGPDGSGFYHDDGVSLGHRRLSIIDLAGGRQPLANEDGTVQVVFNGEIYNYRELRERLRSEGHRFATESDTEVIVHLYEEVGEQFPEHLRGMFAIALWDRRSRRLVLTRDRLGEKPLYYTTSIPGLACCFASELKALRALPDCPGELDPTAAADYLALGYVPDPKSIYKGITKLPPAHTLVVTDRDTRLFRYWQPPLAERGDRSFAQAKDELASLAQDSVRGQMISDVPLGAFLSGGVDSSAVVALMAGVAAAPKTFSIGFDEREFSELEYARMVAERFRTDHHEEVVTPSIDDVFADLAQHYDEPFADSSAVPTLYLAKMTRRYVTVALSGDGADEAFGGYRRYRMGVLEQRIRDRFPDWFRASVFEFGGRRYPKFEYLPQIFRAKALLANLAQDLGNAYFTSMSGFRDEGLRRVLSPELRSALGDYSPREDFVSRFARYRDLGPLGQMQAVDLETYLPGDILVKTDRATMAYSLESRSPWLDHRIVELGLAAPTSFKLQGRTGKRVLKEMIGASLPAPVISRPKHGFMIPLAKWLRGGLRERVKSDLDSASAGGLFDSATVHSLWNEHQSGSSDRSRKIWTLWMFTTWAKHHGVAGQTF